MARLFKVPLVLSARDQGGYQITSPDLPELLAEGDSPDEAIRNVHEALASLSDLYQYLRKPFPATQCLQIDGRPVLFEGVVVRP